MNNAPFKITIDDHKRVCDIQSEFSLRYPFLKIEFFSRGHQAGQPTHRRLMKPAYTVIGQFAGWKNSGTLDIPPGMTVTELEEQFRDNFGLNIQVFRKSGNLWLETTVTDGWTLELQNSQGEALSKAILPYGNQNRIR